MSSSKRRRTAFSASCLSAALALLHPPQAPAQERTDPSQTNDESIHWAYSNFLGTGWYQVSGDLDVFVLRAPFSWAWRAPAPVDGGAGWDAVGVTFDFPVTFGVYRLNVFDDVLDRDNFGTVSFTPGVELSWSPRAGWQLLAYAHAGWGVDTTNDETAWIWDLGLRSRYSLAPGGRPLGLFTELFTAGYSPGAGSSSTLGGFGVGADYRHPVPWTSMRGEPLDLAWDLTYRWYGDELSFNTRSARPSTAIEDEWRLGVALALRERRLRIAFLEFDQLGLAYRLSSDGEFRGLTINLSGPFRR